MEEVKALGYQDKPPYERLRSILQAGSRSKDDGRLDFPAAGAGAGEEPPSRVQVHSHTDAAESRSRFPSVQPLLLQRLRVNLLLFSCFQRTSKRKKASAAAEESEAAERPKRRRVARKAGTAVHWSRETRRRLRLLIITRVVVFFQR